MLYKVVVGACLFFLAVLSALTLLKKILNQVG